MAKSALRGLNLNLLLVLNVLLETHNATSAAARLNMTQPAVSRALARLRSIFGDPLLVKSARGMIPTPRGAALADAVADLVAQIERTVGAPAFAPSASDRVLRVATTDYGAIALLPQTSARLANEAPRIGLEIKPFSSDAFRRLSTGELDLALYSDDPVPQGLRTRKLFDERYCGLARPSHPALRDLAGERMPLDVFVAHPHALVTVLGGRSGVVDAALATVGRERDIVLWLPYFATAALVIGQRDLLLTVPGRVADNLAPALGLVAFQLPFEVESFGYRMIWHERSQADPASLWFRELLAQVARTI